MTANDRRPMPRALPPDRLIIDNHFALYGTEFPMQNTSLPDGWDVEIAALLDELLDVQRELRPVLDEKRRVLLSKDNTALPQMQVQEEQVIERLHACQQRRAELLARARAAGLPSADLRSLVAAIAGHGRTPLARQLDEATRRARQLQHQSLANWVYVQRSLIHVTQMIDLVARGGRMRPTYGLNDNTESGGSLVDQAA